MSHAATMTLEPAKSTRVPLAAEFSATRVVCATCATENGPRQQFCSSCGDQLWEKCPKCEAASAASAKYCGVCGGDLAAMLRELTDKIQTALNDSAALRKKLDFGKAIARLKGLSLFEHSRLKELTAQVRQLVEELVAERERCRVALESVLAKAKKLEANGDDQEALAMLERVPTPLRTLEVREMLDLLTSRLRGVQDLEAEIRALIRAKEYLRVAAPLRDFLTLRPDHTAGLRIANLLRNHFLEAARGKVAEQEYEEGLRLLELILPVVRDAEVEKYLANVREVCWLLQHLRSAPVIDRTLVDLAKRLPKMIPNDVEAARLCTAIHDRYREAVARNRGRDIVTEAGLGKSSFGCGISRMPAPQSIMCDDEGVRGQLEQNPGRFSVALGLALQGLGMATLETNLATWEEAGLLSRLTLPTRRRTVDASWGFDFGESSIKVVRLVKHEESRAKLTFCEIVPYSEPIIRGDAIGEKNDILQEAVGRFLVTNAIAGNDSICASLMAKEVLTKLLHVPSMKPRKMAEAMRYEVQHQVPMPLDELNWDFAACLPADEGTNGPVQQQMVLLVAKMLEIRSRLRVFEKNGLELNILQAEPVALHNFAQHERLATDSDESSQDLDLRGFLDLGLRTTTIILSATDLLWSRSLPLGGSNFTEAIARDLGVSLDQAEELKREPHRAKRLSRLHDPIRSVVELLVNQAQRSLQGFSQDHPGRTIEHFVLLGGSSRLHGLLWYLLEENKGNRVRLIDDGD